MVQLTHNPEPVLEVVFYKTESGVEPVRDWLKSFDSEQRNSIGRAIMYVQFNWPVGMPLVRHLAGPIWEVRTILERGKVRVLFAVDDDEMIILNGFIKKSLKTPKRELELAKRRLSIWQKR